jgi:hypothetical protein
MARSVVRLTNVGREERCGCCGYEGDTAHDLHWEDETGWVCEGCGTPSDGEGDELTEAECEALEFQYREFCEYYADDMDEGYVPADVQYRLACEQAVGYDGPDLRHRFGED